MDNVASEYYQRPSKNEVIQDQEPTEPTINLPTAFPSRCLGTIADLELFEELCLADDKITVVASYTKVKPVDTIYDYYLYPNDNKNSLIVYSGHGKVCEFYVSDWEHPNREIYVCMQGMAGESGVEESASRKSGEFKKREKVGEGEMISRERSQHQN